MREQENAAEKATGRETERDNSRSIVGKLCQDIAREQGGTEVTPISDHGKGNSGEVSTRRERVNSDPQGFQYTDRPRADSNMDDENEFYWD